MSTQENMQQLANLKKRLHLNAEVFHQSTGIY